MNSVNASQVILVVKSLPANAGDIGDAISIPGSGRSPEEGMATHSSILAWEIPWTEEPGWLLYGVTQSRTQLERLSMHALSNFSWAEEHGGLQSMGSHRIGHDWRDSACIHGLIFQP